MPAEFLSAEQRAAYPSFAEMPLLSDLEKFFLLDDFDRNLIAQSRADSHRLGVAVQIGTVRYKGLFLEDPLAVPWPVVDYLAEQLGIGDASQVKKYAVRAQTAYDHAWVIRDTYGYHTFEDRDSWTGRQLTRSFQTFLHGRAWTHAEGPVALFEQSVAWLRRHRVLLPGVTVLERLVGSVRERADVRMYTVVAKQVRRADPDLPEALSGLLVVPEGSRVSELEKLRQAPKRASGTEMVRALQRVDNLAAFGLGRVAVSKVPVRRMKTLAKYGAGSKAPALDRLVEPRRTATLLAVTRSLEAETIDDALDLFALLVTNQVRAYDLLRMFACQGNPTPLRQAFAEYGRIDKTLHLLSMLDPMDSSYRRSLGKQLSVQESRHRLARKICHGNAGKIRQAYREGQEDQLAALGLVLNAVVLWNSKYLSAIVDQLRAQGVPVKDEDVARLSPLGHAHLNCLGRYAIASSAPDKGLRPLLAAAPPQDAASAVVDENGV